MKSFRIPDNRIYHAYMLEGEDMAALEKAAKDFAERILQDSIRVEAEVHPDLILVRPEKANVISVGDVRSQIADTVDTRPYEAEYKLYVVPDAEKMNVQAQNALLKTMEEPPEYVILLLLCRNANIFLDTILSRVVLMKAGEADAALQYHKEADLEWVKETLKLLGGIQYCSTTDILNYIKMIHSENVEVKQVFLLLELLLRDILVYKSTEDVRRIYAQEAAGSIISIARQMSYAVIGQSTDLLEDSIQKIGYHVNEDLLLENLLQSVSAWMQQDGLEE